MKILRGDDGSSDYEPDILFHGLCKLLGPESVPLYPIFGRRGTGPPSYPGMIGCNDGWGLGYASEADLIRDLDAGIFFAIIVRRRSAQHFSGDVRAAISRTGRAVILDGEDHADRSVLTREGCRNALGIDARVAFCREAALDADWSDRVNNDGMVVYSMQFGCVPELIPPEDPWPAKEWDVGWVWASKNNSQSRKDVDAWMWRIESTHGIRVFRRERLDTPDRDGERDYIPHVEYAKKMRRCKVTLSCRGAGYDTLRAWELPVIGSFMMIENPTIWVHDALAHAEPGSPGGHACYFNTADFGKFEHDLLYWIQHDEEREERALAARTFCIDRHSTEARARQFIAGVAEAIGQGPG